MNGPDVDVAVVGASLAGCTVATLLGRAGARVAVLERHPDPDAYKVVCTHFLQPSAVPTLQRLGVVEAMEAAGARANPLELYTRYGWVRASAGDEPPLLEGYNLRRAKLDPILRAAAASTPGVEVLQGETAIGLLRAPSGRVTGVQARDREGAIREVRARAVVAADGRGSPVARLAGVRARVKRNGRFGYFAHFRGVKLSGSPGASQGWFLDPDMAIAFPNDEGITVLAVLPHRDRLPEWKADRERAFADALAALPDGPDLGDAERVSPMLGSLEAPSVIRAPAHPGLALAGDAAMTSDPIWGVGCGFALQSAEWLADELAGSLTREDDVDAALRRYARRHRWRLVGHHLLMNDYSTGRRMTPVERAMYAAGARDPQTARKMHFFGARMGTPQRLMLPVLARVARVTVLGPSRPA